MEKRDLYDKDRNLTNEIIYPNMPIPENRYLLVVLIFIQNSEGKFLIQKRSKVKNGLYATTGGHPKSGEDSITGIITEVNEELGITLNKEDIKLYYSERFDEERIFCDNYYIKLDVDLKKIKLQEEEVESVTWLTKEEIIEMHENGMFFLKHFNEFELLLEKLDKNEI